MTNLEQSVETIKEYIEAEELRHYYVEPNRFATIDDARYKKAIKIHTAEEIILELMDKPFEDPVNIIFKHGLRMKGIEDRYKDIESKKMYQWAFQASDEILAHFV